MEIAISVFSLRDRAEEVVRELVSASIAGMCNLVHLGDKLLGGAMA